MIQKIGHIIFNKKNKKILCLVITILISFSFQTVSGNKLFFQEKNRYDSLYLEYEFSFDKPKLKQLELYDMSFTDISMSGTYSIGQDDGMPIVQIRPVQILLPQGTKLKDISVSIEDVVEIDTASIEIDLKQKPIVPSQKIVPLGQDMPKILSINQDVYSSKEGIPSLNYIENDINYCRGYAILNVDLYPTKYVPSEGKLFYYPNMTVQLNLEETGEKHRFYRDNPNDKEWVKNLVSNPEIINSYGSRDLDESFYEGGLCDTDEDFDYVIIVREHLYDFSGTTYNWDDFISRKESAGIKTTRVKVEDISACDDYHNSDSPFDDQQAQIRQFCIDAYQDWGTEYILVAGDQEGSASIPRRLMHYEGEKDQYGNRLPDIESDLYWSNLDKTFNADGDNEWGEKGDSGFDLYSELFIGSIPCDEAADISNWMTKSFYYEDSTDIDYLNNNAFYGGDTGWSCQGDDFMDFTFKGTDRWLGPSSSKLPDWLGFLFGFDTWNELHPDQKFDNQIKWTGEPTNPGWQGGDKNTAINGLKNAINNNEVTLLFGVAHANPTMSLDVGKSSWESSYHNTKPFFIHDYGCHCGDMSDSDDGILHSMLFHDSKELAFGCVYNTGYGWGNGQSTNASSSLQQKLFCDYFLDLENNSHSQGNWQLGKAMAYSKDTMAPTINWRPSYEDFRGIIQGCLLFADPALRINLAKTELSYEPSSHDFGDKYKSETDSTSFEIWNSNSETLTYTLSEDCDWVSVSPMQGSSEGEHDTIEVNINTISLDFGNHSCEVHIDSNGGNGIFKIEVNIINRPPNPPFNETPNNEGKGVDINPTLSVQVSDIDNDDMEVRFYNADDNILIDTIKNIKSGETASIKWNDIEYGETYRWYAVADDGVFETQSEIFNFTTNCPPVFSSISPINNSANVSMFLKSLKVDIMDPDGDSFDWFIKFESDLNLGQSQGISDLDGEKICDITSLEPLKEYTWTVEATDINGATNKAVYIFKTIENTPPEQPKDSSPKNNANNIEINTILNWTCIDPDQGDELFYDVYLGKNNNPSIIKQKTTDTFYAIPYYLELNTRYYWKVVATDNFGESISSEIWSFTTSSIPPPPTSVNINFPKSFCWPGIKAEIENKGDEDASNINWSIYVKGGFLNKTNILKTGNIKRLNASEKTYISTWNLFDIKSNFKSKIFGFGKVVVTAEAKDIHDKAVGKKIVEGTIVGPFVLLSLS